MSFETKIITKLNRTSIHFYYFVDISLLSGSQTKGMPFAILFGKALSKNYLKNVSNNPNFVSQLIQNEKITDDEFHQTEIETDSIADSLAYFIQKNKYEAFSQSEKNLEKNNSYDLNKQQTPLPHKTIALLTGFGWIGKHNLLISKKYGSAFSMCSVLTNVSLTPSKNEIFNSECGDCQICFDACVPGALTNTSWFKGIERDKMLLEQKCTTCLQCMAQCPWTQKYFEY